MTPAEKDRARDIIANATPGAWSYENLNWVGRPLFAVYASDRPNERGVRVFNNIDPDANSYNNVEFITEGRSLFPRAMQHIGALEAALEDMKAGKPASAAPVLTAAEIARAKELLGNATKGEWSWEDDSHLGPGVRTVYAGRGPMMHGYNLFGRMDTGPNGDNDLDFITGMHALFPKALTHIETLEREIAVLNKPSPSARPRSGNSPKP